MIARLGVKARTLFLLGPVNVANVMLHRLSVRVSARTWRVSTALPSGPFFRPTANARSQAASPAWRDSGTYFGWLHVTWPGRTFPDWHANPVTGTRVPNPARPWWLIRDHDDEVGDIKAVWEASRFGWVLAMAQRMAAGDVAEGDRLNAWLANWCLENPAYLGPNWKCGQEASIRVLHLAMAAVISKQADDPSASLLDLVEAHLKRIVPTMRYAMAQDNNHGASEAAALFVGGSWLAKQGRPRGIAWETEGRVWLEKWTRRIISPDGSTGQYSVNYHRFVVDILSMVEVWRRSAVLGEFSPQWRESARSASRWLAAMVNTTTGDAFNVGANDGSRLLPLTDTGYRDFRPSVQLAMTLFASSRAYSGDGAWNEPLHWLGIQVPKTAEAPGSNQVFDNCGFMLMHRGPATALLRYPRYRFRPSHADALHLDLLVAGKNLLRDAGTFSYHDPLHRYFNGTGAHNTVQFDDRDQMPYLSRFLFGDWLRTSHIAPPEAAGESCRSSAAYSDRHGASHSRTVTLSAERLTVRDDIAGFASRAVLRWRLAPGPWRTEGQSVTDGENVLSISSTMPVVRLSLVEGWESRYYLQKTAIPVLEVEVRDAGALTSEFRWSRT